MGGKGGGGIENSSIFEVLVGGSGGFRRGGGRGKDFDGAFRRLTTALSNLCYFF